MGGLKLPSMLEVAKLVHREAKVPGLSAEEKEQVRNVMIRRDI